VNLCKLVVENISSASGGLGPFSNFFSTNRATPKGVAYFIPSASENKMFTKRKVFLTPTGISFSGQIDLLFQFERYRKIFYMIQFLAFIKIPGRSSRLIFTLFIGLFLNSCSNRTTTPVGSIETKYGEILFKFHPETPRHKARFIALANAHYWDSLTFNRIVPNFVIQGGCPDVPEGFAGSPHLEQPEFHDSLRHIYGAVGAGRDDNPEMKSAVCQFYLVQNKKGLARLDGKYTVFGQLIKGFEVMDSIAHLTRDKQDQPLSPVSIKIRIKKLRKTEASKLGLI
jgi:peptidyl-prolyl cis-trans isomerase B (cyclophilin B)